MVSLTLDRYGNYQSERIVFDPSPGVVNILLAPNGAGKSVLRRAFGDLLFGIHSRTPMDFRYGYRGMRLAAEIILSDGTRAVFNRRKTRGNIVTDAAGEPFGPGFLTGIVGSRDRGLLERLFALDTEALRAGGQALLASGGDVASALLSAAGGIREARALKRKLERQRDDLAPVHRAGTRPFYVALDTFLDARRRVAAAMLRPDEWERESRELDSLTQQQHDQNNRADAASADIARLNRIRAIRPWLARFDSARSWLETHKDSPRLPPDMRRALADTRLDIATKSEAARLAETDLEAAERDADGYILNILLLARATDIEALVEMAGAAGKARDDLPGLRARHDHAIARIRDLSRQIGSLLPPERAAEAVPARALLTRTRERIKEHTQRAAAVRGGPSLVHARARDLAEIEEKHNSLGPDSNFDAVEALIGEIGANGGPTAQRTEALNALTDADATLAAALARVPGWTGDAAALSAIAPLPLDHYRRHDDELTAARAENATVEERYQEEMRAAEKAQDGMAMMLAEEGIPDGAALAAARARREAGWRLIYRHAFSDENVSPDEVNAFDSAPLPLAFERAVAAADAIADRRFAESSLLAKIGVARQAVLDSERRTAMAAERARLSGEKLRQIRRVWAAICATLPLGDEPSAADIQVFLTARDRAIDARHVRALAIDAVARLELRHGQWAAALAAYIGSAETDLPKLLALANHALTQAKARQKIRIGLDADKARAAKELSDAKLARTEADRDHAAWHDKWRAVLAELGRAETEEPAETDAVLQILSDLERECRETGSLSERISGIEGDVARFAHKVQDLRIVTLPDDPFEAARNLGQALTIERAREQRLVHLTGVLTESRARHIGATRTFEAARVHLGAILELIGAETIDNAEQCLTLSEEQARVEAARDDAELKLREHGDGFSVAALREEAEQIPPDEIAARIDTAANARTTASEAAQDAATNASALRVKMKLEEASTGANDAAADQQAAIASISRTLDDATVFHTASLMLAQALEIVEQSADSGVLRRLTEVFQTLTGGAHTRVVTEPGDDGAARLALVQRDFPEERQRIDQLSEGTRDQLFLALRVAAIEDHLRTASPLPFIADDILQTFDDDRARAALRVLTGLSRHTQVILLTHHRHVAELAAETAFQCTVTKV